MQLKTDSQIKAYKLPTDKNQAEISTTTKNLYLKVNQGKKGLTKSFIFIYYENNQRKRITLGQYPTLTLSEAIKQTIDFNAKRQKGENLNALKIPTFAELATQFLEFQKGEIGEKSLQDKKGRIEKYLYPSLKDKQITDLNRRELIETIEKRHNYELDLLLSTETSRKTFGILKAIMKFAVSKGYIENSPLGDIDFKDSFKRIKTDKHFNAITDINRLKDFIQTLKTDTSLSVSTRNALAFGLHTALRDRTLRLLKWDYVDFSKDLITIPSQNMKTKKDSNDFKLPLTHQTKAILKEMQRYQKGAFIFYGTISANKAMSENTLNQAIKRLGFGDEMVFHGLRTTFSTICNEHTKEHGLNSEIVELCLDHAPQNRIKAIYDRSERLNERAELMQWYSDFLDRLGKNE